MKPLHLPAHALVAGTLVASLALPLSTSAQAETAQSNDASLYSKTAKGNGTIDMKRPLAKFVRIKRYWAGHDGTNVYAKVKMRHLPTPADVAAEAPDATFHISFDAAQTVDENGQPATLGFIVGELVVTAKEIKVVKVRQDDDPNGCRTEFSYDYKTRILIASAPWSCMPGYDAPADGTETYASVFASVSYEDEQDLQKKGVADSVSFQDVT